MNLILNNIALKSGYHSDTIGTAQVMVVMRYLRGITNIMQSGRQEKDRWQAAL